MKKYVWGIVTLVAAVCVMSIAGGCEGKEKSDLFIDKLTGAWDVEEYVMIADYVYLNNHTIFVKKIDDTTIEIDTYTNTMAHVKPGYGPYGDKVRATIDNEAETMTIGAINELTPTWSADGEKTFLMPVYSRNLDENFGQAFPAQTFSEGEDGKLRMFMEIAGLTMTYDEGTLPITGVVVPMDEAGKVGDRYFMFQLGTAWIKR